MKRFSVVALVCAALAGACGTSEEEQRAEAAARAAEESKQAAEASAQEAAKGIEAMAKGLEQLASGKGPDGEKVEPVRFQDLIALLPELEGWEREEPRGERMTSPFPTANAKVSYRRGDASIEVEIVDSAFNQLLLAPIAMFLQVGYSQESTSGYEKSTPVNGQPGWEKWDSGDKRGEVNALVNKRFLVNVEGYGIEDPAMLQEVAGKIDFDRLAALK